MQRYGLAFLIWILSVPFSFAQGVVPDSRFVVSRDLDFFGSDLSALYGVGFQTCQRACEANDQCNAFTFNTRSDSCFPKSSVSDRQPYEGAFSAERIPTDPAVLAAADDRAGELSFLNDQDLAQARSQAGNIGGWYPAGGYALEPVLQASQAREREGDTVAAMRWMGVAVSLTDRSDIWVDYARLNLAIDSESSSNRMQNAERALSASVNGYLRATDAAAQASALVVLAQSLDRNRRGKDMIPALRLSQLIQPRDDTVAALEDAIGKYGFRVTEHRIDNDAAEPRICIEFSEPLVKAGQDYEPFVRLPGASFVTQADGRQLCIDGVAHGTRYQVTVRAGLPAASGETLFKDVALNLYVQDRSPSIRFPGRSYVLPRTADAALPIETVNVDTVALRLRRISDRNLLRAVQDSYFGRPLAQYQDEIFASEIAEEIWVGTAQVQNNLNASMTTRLPMDEAIAGRPAGIYALTARIPGVDPYDDPGATQWFVLSDLGLSVQSGTDGLHLSARALSDASAKAGLDVTLLSRANAVLGTTQTDTDGYARFEAGLTRGTGGAEPALVVAREADTDIAFLSLSDPAFDLSDRGVEGRPPAPPVDVFVTTDRGAYRVSETIYVTALTRDGQAAALDDLPLTAVLSRPDGVEYSRQLSNDSMSGGHVFALPVGATAPRGTWRIDLKSDLEAPALASTTVLVEDFLPERIDFDLTLPNAPIVPPSPPELLVDARYLFGAPGADLVVEGEVSVRSRAEVAAFPGFRFGRHDVRFDPRSQYLDPGSTTNAQGRLAMPVVLPDYTDPAAPLVAEFTVRVSEGSGRPVERQITRPLAPAGAMIGIKPLFDDVAPEGSDADFEIVGIGPDLSPTPMQVRWTLNRIETRYEWYQLYGNWNWEPTTIRKRIAVGEAELGGSPLQLSQPVDWGEYELVVERLTGDYVASSVGFYAGWYAPADASSTPDTLEVSLDRTEYDVGSDARLRVVPRFDGTALISVMSNRLIDRKVVDVTAGENLIPLQVTEDWGAGAYVTVSVLRPMDQPSGQNPARALGLVYAAIRPGPKALQVAIEAPELLSSTDIQGGKTTVGIRVAGGSGTEPAFVTLAAVDLGILNLTGFETPDPEGHYFGQRRLGMELRDVYGRLINGMNGAMGQVRSGGDAGAQMRLQSPPPTEKLMAFFSGPVKIGPDGTAEVDVELPPFNGTVRLMAVAWSPTGIGAAGAEMIVRDPVVVSATVPRFLAPGDESRILLEIVHADGPAGEMGLTVSGDGITLDQTALPRSFELATQEKASFAIAVSAQSVGDHSITTTVVTPDGLTLSKVLNVPVRANDPEIAVTRRFSLDAGDTFTFDENVFSGLRPGTGSATLAAGEMARLDVPGLLSALDRYPYGCTEQITSGAMPLLYLSAVAESMGLNSAADIQARVDGAIRQVLTRQVSNGAFGLWRAESGDFWLDAYVSDFLSRARAQGFAVPDLAFRLAMDNIRNRINYAPDFDRGGEDIAYALLVLAREGAASMGDLRYYADAKSDAFATPLAAAQLGAALAAYGDQTRADHMFRQAEQMLNLQSSEEPALWRADYGTGLRDAAGVLSLATESGNSAIARDPLIQRIAAPQRGRSTQEAAWSLLAAHALVADTTQSGLSVNGVAATGPFVKLLEDDAVTPVAIRNTGQSDTNLTLTTFGVPEIAPEAGGYGYTIERIHYTMDGELMSLPAQIGTRYVTVLRVTALDDLEARLMVNDPLPAGLEIDNPNLLRSGDVAALDWLDLAEAQHTEFRADRFLAAVDLYGQSQIDLAYIVRAVSPGVYRHPAASVEDMYRPQYRARTETGEMVVSE